MDLFCWQLMIIFFTQLMDFHQEFDYQDVQHLLEFELQQKRLLLFIGQALKSTTLQLQNFPDNTAFHQLQ
jgi:hypothetical protein